MFKGEAFNKRAAICVAAAMMCGVILAGITYIRMLPVEWDAGVCGGGYATFVFNKYGKELAQKYPSRLSNKDDILCAKAICGTQSARWEGQTFYLIFDVQYADAKQGVVTETVRFIGRRVWFDTYKWGAGIAVHAK